MAKKAKHYKTFRRPRTRAIKAINNLYVVNELSREALGDLRKELKAHRGNRIDREIPVIQGDHVVVVRRRSKILQLLENSINRDLYGQAIIAGVAVVEDYLVHVLSLLLTWYPEKLVVGERKVDVSMVIAAKSLDELLGDIIEKQIASASYSAPQEYFRYFENLLSIELPDKVKDNYTEVKATRDVLIHNSGIANSLYRRKAEDLARAKEGEELPLNSDYFDQATRALKAVVVAVYARLLRKYGNVELRAT